MLFVEHLLMASQIREWSGINTFAPATQTKLLELLGNLKQEVLFLLFYSPLQIIPNYAYYCLCFTVDTICLSLFNRFFYETIVLYHHWRCCGIHIVILWQSSGPPCT